MHQLSTTMIIIMITVIPLCLAVMVASPYIADSSYRRRERALEPERRPIARHDAKGTTVVSWTTVLRPAALPPGETAPRSPWPEASPHARHDVSPDEPHA